jgi:cytochrome c-type protein NapB
MNGKRLIVMTLATMMLAYGGPLFSQENVATMRGDQGIENPSVTPEYKSWTGKSDLIAREFDDQPPLIPHKSQSHKINLKTNKCLSCHGLDTYEEKEATKVSDTHFKDRDGNQLDDVSSSRYFCTQCHVEQRDAVPLVVNEFQPADAAK